MSGAGASGGYGPPQNTLGMSGTEYAPGPIGWNGVGAPIQSGAFLAASWLNQQFSLPLDYLTNPPMFQALNMATATSLVNSAQGTSPNTVFTNIPFDYEQVDPWGMFNNPTDATKFAVPLGMDGMWLVQAHLPLGIASGVSTASAGAQIRSTQIANSIGQWSGYQSGMSSTMAQQLSSIDLIPCMAGDLLELAGSSISSAGTWATVVANTASPYNPPSGGTATLYAPKIQGRWAAAIPSWTPLPAGYSLPLSLPNTTAWTNAQTLSSTQLNAQVGETMMFLAYRPWHRVDITGWTAPSVAHNTNTVLTTMGATRSTASMGTLNFDPWGTWTASSGTWTCKLSGIYMVSVMAGFSAPSATGTTYCGVTGTFQGTNTTRRGAGSTCASGYPMFSNMMIKARFNAGDTLQPWVYQNTGATQTPNAARFFTLWMSS